MNLPTQLFNFKKTNKKTISRLSLLAALPLLFAGCNQSTISSKPIAKSQKSTPVYQSTTPDVTPDHPITDNRNPIETAEIKTYDNVWHAMQNQFQLSEQYQGKYDRYIKFYQKRQRHLEKVSERAQPYLYYIYQEVQKRQMPMELALLPVVESGFRAHARSHQRAVGLWQFIPSTAELYDLDRNWWYDGRKDVVRSTKAALDYLEKLQRLNEGDWLLALASYNAGLGNVYKAQRKFRKKNKHIANINDYQPNYWEIQKYLPKETQAYVPKLFAIAHLVKNSQQLDIKLQPVANQPFFKQVVLDKQVALNQVASLSATSEGLLKTLNPGYHQMATPPKGPYNLLLPIDNAEQFRQQLTDNSDIYSIQWQKYRIRSGDSLSVIARKHKTSQRAIKALNGMKSSRIRAGKTLLIPIPAKQFAKLKTQLAATKAKLNNKPKGKATYWHTVTSGDSLWKLARYYNVSTATLCNWNNIDIKTPLRKGQKIAIYSNKYGKKITHTLKAGENLWLLATRYNVTSRDIAGWNKISTKKTLQPGMKLTIWTNGLPSEHVVKSGDNLWLIAKANQLSAKKLASYNNLSLQKPLQPGQVILIPNKSANQS